MHYNRLMKYVDAKLTLDEILQIRKDFGDYVKVTVDILNNRLIVGCELHADGEAILLEKGGKQDDIWGGGVDFTNNSIKTFAMLNIRPRLDNDSMEILDSKIKAEFNKVVKDLFENLWTI